MGKGGNEIKVPTDRIKCQNCDSHFGYLRVKSHQWVCRTCGFVQAHIPRTKRGVLEIKKD